MHVTRLSLRDFRNYEELELELPPGLAVVAGPNGAGKTNLLEALYFGCTGRSPRTSNERELVRRGTGVTRVVVDTRDDEASHRIEVGFEPGEAKRLRLDGSAVDSLSTTEARPLVSVFMPERLELVKGAPAGRRAHLDQVVAALWPARAQTRADYSRALAQRNALLARIRAGASGPGALDAWDAELARQGIALMEDRREAVDRPGGALRGPGRGAGTSGAGGAALPTALARRRHARAPGRADRAPRCRPRAGLHRPRSAPRRAAVPARRRRACAPTARRASSGHPCSHCCSPSASCSRRAADARRSCCSTT